MSRRLNIRCIGASQNIVSSVAFHLQVASTNLCATVGISISLLQNITTIVAFIVEIDHIKSGSALILLSSVEVINLVRQSLISLLISSCDLFKSVHLPIVPFLSEVSEFVLLLFELLCAHASISHCEVLIKTFAF